MDYTTLTQVKNEVRIKTSTDDSLLGILITAASRAIDRKCTGQPGPASDNYFQLETIVNEALPGRANSRGEVTCYPHKPLIASVAAFAYRADVTQSLNTVDTSRVDMWGNKVTAYPLGNPLVDFPGRCRVQISYTGGLSGSTADLPADLVELCTLLCARFYKEGETGFTDSIGVAELAQMVYTKAWPVRLTEQLQTYIRKEGWNFL
jgi:hypothetical protein